jgi:hypothetical protein
MSNPFSMTTYGSAALMARFEKLINDTPKQMDKILYKEASAIFRKSQRIVPVHMAGDPKYKGIPGNLKASGVVEKPVNHEVLIGYGGTAATYALYVHEKTSPEPKWTLPGKSSKFLEKPFMEAMQGFEKRVRDEIAKNDTGAPASEPAGSAG